MKKVIVLTALITLLASCGTKNDDEKTVNNLENKPQIHTVLKPKTPEQKYWALAKFIKTDLSLKEDKALQEILEQRKQRISQIKEILLKAQKEWNFEEKMQEVEKMRETCKNRILPYVAEDKKELFNKTCDSWNDKLRKTFWPK